MEGPMIEVDEKQAGTDDLGRLVIEWDVEVAETAGENSKRVPLGANRVVVFRVGTQRNVEVLDSITNAELTQRLKQALE
jgi:hypothetical protein